MHLRFKHKGGKLATHAHRANPLSHCRGNLCLFVSVSLLAQSPTLVPFRPISHLLTWPGPSSVSRLVHEATAAAECATGTSRLLLCRCNQHHRRRCTCVVPHVMLRTCSSLAVTHSPLAAALPSIHHLLLALPDPRFPLSTPLRRFSSSSISLSLFLLSLSFLFSLHPPSSSIPPCVLLGVLYCVHRHLVLSRLSLRDRFLLVALCLRRTAFRHRCLPLLLSLYLCAFPVIFSPSP